ncbi:hypothetical protein K1T71_003246 [Dendrolimus kikuchii]|uniref:Uncharacterized protein n=1 Tax=Dendrolimus kikuchii TaxID=765133 RepID=A0ACC1DBH6_9NEOP|nr:hypothetical protein K1T71_003246 [Dendrolimus kikuchii]
MYYFNLIVVILLNFFLFSEVSVIMTLTLVYHNEMSEYCRRQVVPSVFVSRQLTTANSHILHFSKLELPYTCYISIRTESGNNLILVTEVLSNHDLINTCSKNPNQLIVYELGETFGGYWGPLPNDLIRQEYPDTNKYYTLKTTSSTTDDDFITLEVPLVNVSGSFIPGESVENENIDSADLFELLYDVTPWPSVKYDTSILPLVQFSINRQKTTVLWNPNGKPPLQSYLPLTPDVRYTFSTSQKYEINIYLFILSNDNLHDRVALRDIQQFSGPILYNICDSKEAGGRSVFLFNASRIVLFIGNFSVSFSIIN